MEPVPDQIPDQPLNIELTRCPYSFAMWALRNIVAELECLHIPAEIIGVIVAVYAELTHVDVVCSGDEAFALLYDGIYRVVQTEIRGVIKHKEFSVFVNGNTWEKVSSMRVIMRSVHTWHCMVSDGITVMSQGRNMYGCLGRGMLTGLVAKFGKVPIDGPITAIACGGSHSMVLTHDGLFGFGNNAYGQLGIETHEDHVYGIRLIRTDVTAVACGEQHTLIITSDGSLRGCGYHAPFASMVPKDKEIGGYYFYKIGQASAIRAYGNTSFVYASDLRSRLDPHNRRWTIYGASMISVVPEFDRDDARDMLKRMVTPQALADQIPAISRARGRIMTICIRDDVYIVATRNGIFTVPRAK